jgi:hypothetical protein
MVAYPAAHGRERVILFHEFEGLLELGFRYKPDIALDVHMGWAIGLAW